MLFFVFFKQKTAYELRISDWSSDVCSSDLSAIAAAWGTREADYFFAFVLIPVGLSVIFGRDFRREARLAEDRSLLERRAEEVLSQIGRASCRERVCQYV